MNITEYRKLKRQIDEKYQGSMAKAEKERVAGLAAIERVWRMYHKPRQTNGSTDRPSYGSLAQTIKDSLQFVPIQFNKDHVLIAMKQVNAEVATNCNANSLSGCLIRLVQSGVIVKVVPGKGRKPSEFRKKEDVSENILVTDYTIT